MGKRDSDADKPPRILRFAYVLAAAVIWVLVWYNGSSLNRPAPARLASRMVQACAHTQP